MLIELENHGLKIQFEVPVPNFFHGQKIHDEGFRIDLLIEDKIVVELKSKEAVNDIEKKHHHITSWWTLLLFPKIKVSGFQGDILDDGVVSL